MQSLLWSCLKPPAGFAERKKKLYSRLIAVVNSCIACYLLVIYILYVGWSGCSLILSASGFAIMKKQYLSSFVAGGGILVSCIFMCFSINFQTNSYGFFVCLLVFFFIFSYEIAFSSILRIKTIFCRRHSILREKKSQVWTDAYTDHIWRSRSNAMMAKPINTLELHYPMTQFLIIKIIIIFYKYMMEKYCVFVFDVRWNVWTRLSTV